VHSRKRVRWRLTSSFQRALDTLFGSTEVFAERLAALTDGYFELRPHPAGEIVPPLEVMDAVQQGTVPVGHTASYYYTGKNPALAFDAGVPWGLNYRQQMSWLLHGGGLELTRALYADFNIVNFPAGSTGTQMGGWFREEVDSLADLEGLRMRIPGLAAEVMDRLGVTVQVIGGPEIYQALERGLIDAAEWVGTHADEKIGFHEIARYYYYPGWWEPGPTLSFLVNRDSWNELPADYQQAFQAAAAEASTDMTARYDALNPQALDRLIAAGVQLRPFTEDVLEASMKAAFEIYEEQASADAGYREIYESWKKARAESFRWWNTAELACAKFAFPRPDPPA
jgi:TRAP-type mannitol/chloroaromatic compound transport system substrate-binding protein